MAVAFLGVGFLAALLLGLRIGLIAALAIGVGVWFLFAGTEADRLGIAAMAAGIVAAGALGGAYRRSRRPH